MFLVHLFSVISNAVSLCRRTGASCMPNLVNQYTCKKPPGAARNRCRRRKRTLLQIAAAGLLVFARVSVCTLLGETHITIFSNFPHRTLIQTGRARHGHTEVVVPSSRFPRLACSLAARRTRPSPQSR